MSRPKPKLYTFYCETLQSGTKIYMIPIRVNSENLNQVEGFIRHGEEEWRLKLALSPLSWNESDVFKIVDSSTVPNKRQILEVVLT